MKISTTAIIIAGIFYSFTAVAEPLSIKGVMVDQSANCEQLKSLEVRKGNYYDSCGNQVLKFMIGISFMGSEELMYISRNSEGIIQDILLSGFNYEKAVASFAEKYGKPEINNTTIQNGMGAKFEQQIATWRVADQVLMISKHGARINSPSLILQGKAAVKNASAKSALSKDI